MRYFVYMRRSSEREDRQTLALEAQQRELEEDMKRLNLTIVDWLGESRSAYKPNNRPVFDEMMRRIELGEADGILVWHLSRLSRNPVDGGRLIYFMDEGYIKEIRTHTNAYTNSADNKFILAIEFGMSKKSSDDTADYMVRDAKSKLLKGEWVGMAPVGYLNIDKDGKIAGKFYDHAKQTMLLAFGRALKRVEQDPIIGPLMRAFFSWYLLEPRTLRQGADYINRLGIKSSRFKGKFSTSMVERILRNPFYAGLMRYEGELYPGGHDPIITYREFCDIQAFLSGKSHPVLVHHEFVYRGLVQCGECGCAIVGVRKKKPSGKEYEYYTCSKRRAPCGQRPMKPDGINEQVHRFLRDVSIDERVWRLCKQLVKLYFEQHTEQQINIAEQWGRDLALIERKLGNLLDAQISDLISKDDYIAKKNLLLAERVHIEQKIREGGDNARHWLLNAESFFDKAHHAFERFADPDVTIAEKKNILRDIGWNLRLTDGKLTWEYKKPFDVLAERAMTLSTVGTHELGQDKKKNTSLEREVLFWRDGRDSNPQPLP